MRDEKQASCFPPPSQVNTLALCLVVFVALVVRLPGIGRPLVGNFATKNVVYAMIARNWAEGRAPLWEPTLDCLVGGQRSLHLLEFPVSAYLSGSGWRLFGGSLDVWGRATAIVFSVGAVALMYLVVAGWHGPTAALGASLALALSPIGILYGRSFMLESSLVFFTLAAVWSWDRWLRVRHGAWLVLASVALALVLLTKIYMLVLLLPLGAMLVSARVSRRAWAGAAIALAAAVVPAATWYRYAADPGAARASRVYYSVRSSMEVHRPPHPLLGSASFYGRVLDELAGPVLTPIGLALALAGLWNPAWRRHVPWLAACAVLILLLPRKFYEMNYYWMAVLPALAILAGLGWQVVCQRAGPSRLAQAGVLAVALLMGARHVAGPMLRVAAEDRGVVAAGRAAARASRPEEPVVTLHGTTIDLLYYCDRPGWAIDPASPRRAEQIEDCRRRGARLAVVAGSEPVELGGERIESGPNYAVYRIAP